MDLKLDKPFELNVGDRLRMEYFNQAQYEDIVDSYIEKVVVLRLNQHPSYEVPVVDLETESSSHPDHDVNKPPVVNVFMMSKYAKYDASGDFYNYGLKAVDENTIEHYCEDVLKWRAVKLSNTLVNCSDGICSTLNPPSLSRHYEDEECPYCEQTWQEVHEENAKYSKARGRS